MLRMSVRLTTWNFFYCRMRNSRSRINFAWSMVRRGNKTLIICWVKVIQGRIQNFYKNKFHQNKIGEIKINNSTVELILVRIWNLNSIYDNFKNNSFLDVNMLITISNVLKIHLFYMCALKAAIWEKIENYLWMM